MDTVFLNQIIIDQTKKIYTSFMSAITGAINYINPTSIPTPVKSVLNEDVLKDVKGDNNTATEEAK